MLNRTFPLHSFKRDLAFLFLTLLLNSIGLPDLRSTDWPAYRADNSRSGFTPEQLDFPLHPAWTNRASLAPSRTWPEPARGSIWQKLDSIQSRSTEDRAFHPVIAGSRVYFASSSDDQIYCLSIQTGAIQWRFHTEGPVRFAPAFSEGRIVAGSDDGFIYCLHAETGELIWKKRIGPEDRRIPGNGRLISTWPVRTGVLIQNGIVHCFAGLFPSQGVFSAAFQLKDGSPVYLERIEESPQGYLLGTGDEIYVPTGRSNPITVDSRTGTVKKRFTGVGGTFAVVVEDEIVSGPGNSGALAVSQRTSKMRIASFPGTQMVVDPAVSYLLYPKTIVALDRTSFRKLTATKRGIEAELKEIAAKTRQAPANSAAAGEFQRQSLELATRLESIEKSIAACELWKHPVSQPESMIVAGKSLLLGSSNLVTALDAATGTKVWDAQIPGKAASLAVANGHLIVSTDAGEWIAFRSATSSLKESVTLSTSATTAASTPNPATSDAIPAEHASILRRIESTPAARQGFALLIGSTNLALATTMAASTQLSITIVQAEGIISQNLRDQLSKTAQYGVRINVLTCEDAKLPFTGQFANVIINEAGPASRWDKSELLRLLRPYGSLAWLDATKTQEPHVSLSLEGADNWTHLYGNPANTASTEDTRISHELALQWFGGPGPRTMTDRHLRGPAPLVLNGRMFIVGEDLLLAVDAFNGTLLWQLEIPGSRRYSIPYDSSHVCAEGDFVHVAMPDQAWQIEAATGRVIHRQPLPLELKGSGTEWGFLAVSNGRKIATSQKIGASRKEPTYEAVDKAYTSRQPMVTSQVLFSIEPGATKPAWNYESPAIINSTITISDNRIYFFESRQPELRSHPNGRIALPQLNREPLILVSLAADSGRRLWEKPMDLRQCENILYLSATRELLVVTGSSDNPQKDARYHLIVLESESGNERWRAQHDQGKPGELYHGEQVHHPVILNNILVAEPRMYELSTGRPYNPDGLEGHWPITRPGHSCGTMTGAGRSLFFRANNPTVLNIGSVHKTGSRFTRLAPSRPGCWINMVPANGLVLLPEASAGCECDYSIQTSMAFRPISR